MTKTSYCLIRNLPVWKFFYTFKNKSATTAPYGTTDPDFDIAQLCIGAGATYVARGTSYHARMLTDLIVNGA